MAETFRIPDPKQDIPDTPEKRVAELMKLPLANKISFIPAFGDTLRIGPFVFKVTVVNPSQLRFSATLADVIIEGVNDGVSKIVSPYTGTPILKQ